MTDLVLTDFDAESGIARIAFNRPEVLNALNVPLARAFLAAVREVTALQGLRAIVLGGEGRAFVAGGDVASFAGGPERAVPVVNDLLDALNPAIVALRRVDAPVIAAVRGAAAGAGLSLMMAADIIVAATGTKFLMAYEKLGSSPDCGATWFAPRLLGRARTMELLLMGRVLDAEAARDWGLINEVVPADDLDSRVQGLAETLARGPTRAFGQSKRLIDEAEHVTLAEQLEKERAAFLAGTGTADFAEGTAAFTAKRTPVFTGR
ncbi:enoyl-CoA hydratase [Haematobacter missouriensis]|uniref:Enoyl-CoA hydratase n=1 Tax=Haematobacter missouriensis TaxID=366616 RepID=A0A212AJU0_9RHOB|nr:enoyl-CoA hydratase-related protein [Haematobacter missouriensis]KFI32577.1 enoyl-CoA hydratase [Haematobacter missouriensis]OWJ76754.1 enoyl-CoA hydratase [Haematobacter missouriensis]OWJ81748.1 enoyl-CoA hydratase [Haematobacter missouriensis]